MWNEKSQFLESFFGLLFLNDTELICWQYLIFIQSEKEEEIFFQPSY